MATSLRLVAATLLGLAVHQGTAQAGLILRSFIDEPRRLRVDMGWDPETADTVTPNFLNWNVTIRMEPTAVEWIAVAMAQHRVNPDADESLPEFITLTAAVDRVMTPGNDEDAGAVLHPGIGHMDTYRLTFRHAVLPQNNLILLSGQHPPAPGQIPEPTAVLLVSAGLAMLSSGLLRRRSLKLGSNSRQ